jgi:hypothetical protein
VVTSVRYPFDAADHGVVELATIEPPVQRRGADRIVEEQRRAAPPSTDRIAAQLRIAVDAPKNVETFSFVPIAARHSKSSKIDAGDC